ncbi:FMN-binding negative transcriptional regulator [Streptomyces sp. SID5785]|uniref:FMN-binding negative transcriptional regulator n=1 Tax=Streptomyces sp. SID5785 TaxID=2690309 RepID=UPI0013617194|nr:FMN-binding negative transcriptional regulator [Streptomyces sp. SID5785]MZD10430.1 FMN-binding negative transcriptional regulator [Streptomyces sp. SID5785]
MLEQDTYALTDPEEQRSLIRGHGWATLITARDGSPVVSHLPVLLDEDGGEADPAAPLAVVGHLARADAELHRLGEHPVTLVIQGPHGYVSPSMYDAATPYVPTWNFVVAHLHGEPEVLDADATYDVLRRTVDHFEAERPRPWRLDGVTPYARSIAPYTTGFRLTPTRVVAKHKLSQEKPHDVVARVVAALGGDDPHANPELADAMRKALVTHV